MSGEIVSDGWVPGGSITLTGNLTLFARDLIGVDDVDPATTAHLDLERVSSDEGIPMSGRHVYMSTLFTPTGLPVEREGSPLAPFTNWKTGAPRRVSDDRIELDWTMDVEIPANTPPGLYRPRVRLHVDGLPEHRRHLGILPAMEAIDSTPSLPLIRIGAEPAMERLFWVLVLDDIVNGHRGGIAIGDREAFAFANHVVTPGDVTILPVADPRTGAPRTYRLEPFVPMVSFSVERLVTAGTIPFRFPSGELRVRVTRPSGIVDLVGAAPFVQSMSRSQVTVSGNIISGRDGRNSNHVTDVMQLTTLDPSFDYAFREYGLHRIEMEGWIDDLDGRRYEGGGTYEVWASRPLDLEPAVFPGTPFEIGDSFNPVVVVQPPVASDLDLRLRLESTGIDHRIHGRCNRFGYCTLEPFLFDTSGEYRVDLVATHATEREIWKGAATWGSIVESASSPLVTHGRRGFDFVQTSQDQWFFVRKARAGDDHVQFPFHGGDIQWMEQRDPAAGIPKITIQDNAGDFAARVRQRATVADPIEPSDLEDRIVAGEIPLFSSTSSGYSPSVQPSDIDRWGYFYSSVQRPGVRVREMISEDWSGSGYWRFLDTYQLQLGTGVLGDLPNDFKFQFGGAVYRDETDGFRFYGAYGSLFVMIPDHDPEGGRIFPPFQGAAGGPSGGPVMTLKGEEIDIFFHPTGVRAGSVLEVGGRASFAGQIGPTLPSKVEITVTSPSGELRTVEGQANKIGYFYDPSQDFVADEAGVWTADVRVWHDGLTSAGPVQPPYPEGDVLGSRDGELYFYVVERDAPSLGFTVSAPGYDGPVQRAVSAAQSLDVFVRPAEGPIEFTIESPEGLSDVELCTTTVMPGFVLEEGCGTGLSYRYDATALHEDFPNLDLFDADGLAGVDTITFSFLVSGTDDRGERRHLARSVVLQGEELIAPAQEPVVCSPDATTACLLDGRFEVVGEMHDFSAPPRRFDTAVMEFPSGRAESDQAAFFESFDEGNFEVGVKVVDACALPAGDPLRAYWAFFGGLTNAETEVLVVDSVSGQLYRWHNPPGTFPLTLGDTQAFPCIEGSPAVPCERDAETACLLDGRFRVRGAMKDFATPPETFPIRVMSFPGGRAESDQAAFFESFQRGNFEVGVKMVDACSLPAGDPLRAYWAFFGGLTNAETRISVTQLATGLVDEWVNLAGAFPRSEGRTSAFPCE